MTGGNCLTVLGFYGGKWPYELGLVWCCLIFPRLDLAIGSFGPYRLLHGGGWTNWRLDSAFCLRFWGGGGGSGYIILLS